MSSPTWRIRDRAQHNLLRLVPAGVSLILAYQAPDLETKQRISEILKTKVHLQGTFPSQYLLVFSFIPRPEAAWLVDSIATHQGKKTGTFDNLGNALYYPPELIKMLPYLKRNRDLLGDPDLPFTRRPF
jgi:hypothetical protein